METLELLLDYWKPDSCEFKKLENGSIGLFRLDSENKRRATHPNFTGKDFKELESNINQHYSQLYLQEKLSLL